MSFTEQGGGREIYCHESWSNKTATPHVESKRIKEQTETNLRRGSEMYLDCLLGSF